MLINNKAIHTLKEIPCNAYTHKYFSNKYPLLATYVPQSEFRVVKHTNKVTDRFLVTTGCYPCSKLTMHDNVNKVGFLSHIDNPITLLKQVEEIKDNLLKARADLKNILVRHVGGVFKTEKSQVEAVHKLMEKLGLKESQLIEEDVLGNVRKSGIFLDISDGQTTELYKPDELFKLFESKFSVEKMIKYYHDGIYDKKLRFNTEEINKLKKEIKVINNR